MSSVQHCSHRTVPRKPNANGLAPRREDGAKSPRRWFESAVKAAGLTEFTWHCLRHTFASRIVMARVDIPTVQELLGHKAIAMTVRYSHVAPRHTLAAVERLDAPQSNQLTRLLAPRVWSEWVPKRRCCSK
jgi:integrase